MDLTADKAADSAGQEDDIIYDGYDYADNNDSFKDSPYVCYKNVTDMVRSNATRTANIRWPMFARPKGKEAAEVPPVGYWSLFMRTRTNPESLYPPLMAMREYPALQEMWMLPSTVSGRYLHPSRYGQESG